MVSKKILILLIFVMSVGFAYASENSCINCHTNENILKKMVKAPELHSGEGEG